MGKNKTAKKAIKAKHKTTKKAIKAKVKVARRNYQPKDGVFGDVTNRTY